MILVTGGAGFIGSNLVAELTSRGLGPVAVCDRLRDGQKWKNLAKHPITDIVHPDILDDWLEVNGADLDCIFHMGAISATTETDADKIIENNLHLTMYIFMISIIIYNSYLYHLLFCHDVFICSSIFSLFLT